MTLHDSAEWTVRQLPVLPGASEDASAATAFKRFAGGTAASASFLDELQRDVQLLGQRRAHEPFWLVECDLEPRCLVDTSTGLIHFATHVVETAAARARVEDQLRQIAGQVVRG